MENAPTAENMAKFIYDMFRKKFPIESITIYETPTSFSTYN
jgi:6-pyruvoyl-tetrahydropterin synthase